MFNKLLIGVMLLSSSCFGQIITYKDDSGKTAILNFDLIASIQPVTRRFVTAPHRYYVLGVTNRVIKYLSPQEHSRVLEALKGDVCTKK
jgi:hypothetical protein